MANGLSLRTRRMTATEVGGSVWVSWTEVSSLRPRMPPFRLMSSTARLMASRHIAPTEAPPPVISATMGSLTGPWARTGTARARLSSSASTQVITCDMRPLLDSSVTPGRDGFVRLEEAPRVLHDLVDVLRRIFPGIDGHLGLRGETGHLHRDLVRVRGHVVGRDQQRRPDGAHEIARHGEDEVGALRVHAGEEVMDHGHRDVGALLAKLRPPALDVVLVEKIRDLRPETAGLHHRGRDDAHRSPLDQVVNHRPADAE